MWCQNRTTQAQSCLICINMSHKNHKRQNNSVVHTERTTFTVRSSQLVQFISHELKAQSERRVVTRKALPLTKKQTPNPFCSMPGALMALWAELGKLGAENTEEAWMFNSWPGVTYQRFYPQVTLHSSLLLWIVALHVISGWRKNWFYTKGLCVHCPEGFYMPGAGVQHLLTDVEACLSLS